jgi:ribose transport system permease protein
MSSTTRGASLGGLGRVFKKLGSFREMSVLLSIVGFSIIMSFLSPYFFTFSNLRTTMISLSADGIIAIGLTMVLISGGVDLSVGSVLCLAAVIVGASWEAQVMNIWVSVVVALLVSGLCGLINGLFIGKLKINPLITTLAMMGMARGAAFVITQGSPRGLSGVPAEFSALGKLDLFGLLPVMVLIFLVLVVVFDILLRKSAPFRKVFYTGSNEKSAVLSGIDTSRVKIWTYTLGGFLAGISGILTVARFGVATPSAGTGTELTVISAAVIGGASLSGGVGTVFGTVLGIILLSIINTSLVLLRVSVYWQGLISGFILILAVTIDQLSQQKSNRI